MGIGEGLLTGLLGGVAGGAQHIVTRNAAMDKEDETERMTKLQAEIALDRQKALEIFRQEQSQLLAGKVNERAGLLASKRTMQPDDVRMQADSAMGAYNDALKRGDITEDDAAKAATAITEYSDKNLVQNTNVTMDDRMQASMELGQTPITAGATYEHQKKQDLLGNKRADNQHADSMKRMDIQIASQERQFQQGLRASERQAAAIENSTKRQELNSQNAAAKLQFDASKTAYEGISKELVEMQRNGMTDTPSYGDLKKDLAKAEAGMDAAYLSISGAGSETSGKGFGSLWGDAPKQDAKKEAPKAESAKQKHLPKKAPELRAVDVESEGANGKFNVKMSDGTTRIVSRDEAYKLGLNIGKNSRGIFTIEVPLSR